jgi:hypothetical protein
MANIWRIMICDAASDGNRAGQVHQQGYSYYLLLIHEFEDFTQSRSGSDDPKALLIREWELSWDNWTLGRNFCSTIQGRLGWVPHTAQKGDVFAVFKGSEVPHILRKEPNGSLKIISKCYIDGLMYGEAVENNDIPLEGIVIQ